MGNRYGYVRVSSRDQREERQMLAMHGMRIPDSHIYVDKQSGKDFNRPQYQKLLRKIKADDVVFVQSIDRLGRNYQDIIAQWKRITRDKKADIVVLICRFWTPGETKTSWELFFQMLSWPC